eukprot:scaffold130518_cov48-Prasinocladus_malaysianus.AAC.2
MLVMAYGNDGRGDGNDGRDDNADGCAAGDELDGVEDMPHRRTHEDDDISDDGKHCDGVIMPQR